MDCEDGPVNIFSQNSIFGPVNFIKFTPSQNQDCEYFFCVSSRIHSFVYFEIMSLDFGTYQQYEENESESDLELEFSEDENRYDDFHGPENSGRDRSGF